MRNINVRTTTEILELKKEGKERDRQIYRQRQGERKKGKKKENKKERQGTFKIWRSKENKLVTM